jgi:hypothetical protein
LILEVYMRLKTTRALAFLIPAALLVGSGTAQTVTEGGRKLHATLSGAAEIPGPGDPDGSGTVTVIVNPGQGRVCYTLEVSNIATATAAHIHDAPVGVAGPVDVTLSPPSDGDSSGCVDVGREQALEILKEPDTYYVNVHNANFPSGAIRGQLSK